MPGYLVLSGGMRNSPDLFTHVDSVEQTRYMELVIWSWCLFQLYGYWQSSLKPKLVEQAQVIKTNEIRWEAEKSLRIPNSHSEGKGEDY